MSKVFSAVMLSFLSFQAFGKTSTVEGNVFTASCPTQANYATNLITIQQALMASPDYKKLLQGQEKEALQGFLFEPAATTSRSRQIYKNLTPIYPFFLLSIKTAGQ
ncbi:MAG: hypothetical protein FJ116_12730 [Deltaproteobacteria bacterium]|nr:hypothetical protein [Deltaproteobacteria bacterium]